MIGPHSILTTQMPILIFKFMRPLITLFMFVVVLFALADRSSRASLPALPGAQSDAPPSVPPREWIDPDTGHRVIRLPEDSGGASLYFHQNGYPASGAKLVITTRERLSTINLKTRKVEPLVEG